MCVWRVTGDGSASGGRHGQPVHLGGPPCRPPIPHTSSCQSTITIHKNTGETAESYATHRPDTDCRTVGAKARASSPGLLPLEACSGHTPRVRQPSSGARQGSPRPRKYGVHRVEGAVLSWCGVMARGRCYGCNDIRQKKTQQTPPQTRRTAMQRRRHTDTPQLPIQQK